MGFLTGILVVIQLRGGASPGVWFRSARRLGGWRWRNAPRRTF
jgi:hypothetical protein